MAFQPVPDTAECQIEMATGGLTGQNTMYFRKAGGWDTASLQVLAEEVVAAWEANIAATVTTDWALIQVTATNLESTSGIKQIWKPALPIQGTHAGTSSPANVSFAVKFGMPRRGRGISGRVFAFGIPESEVGAGFVSSTYANATAAAWGVMAGAVEVAADCEHVVVHRVVAGIRQPQGDPEGVAFYTYTDLAVDSQKLRLPNHRKAKRRPA